MISIPSPFFADALYSIGRSEPELPILRSLAHIRLAWAEALSGTELDELLAAYERQLADQAIMCRETIRRASMADGSGPNSPERSAHERLIWKSIDENRATFYENELAWAKNLRAALKQFP